MKQDLTLDEVVDLLHHKRSSSFLSRVSKIANNSLFSNAFESLEVEGLESLLKNMTDGKKLIIIQDHQSEYDWIISQIILSQAGIDTAIYAGDNLFVGPLDPFLRACGGFMAIREDKDFYGEGWIKNAFGKISHQKPYTVKKSELPKLMKAQFRKVLLEDNDNLLFYPGTDINPHNPNDRKIGRSYSGRFGEIPDSLLRYFKSIFSSEELQDIVFVKSMVSYERVPEDMTFRSSKIDTSVSKKLKYIYDMYYSFFKFPRNNKLKDMKPRVVLSFDEPVPSLEYTSRGSANRFRTEMGLLQHIYPSHVIFSAIDNQYKIRKNELETRVDEVIEQFEHAGLHTEALYDSAGIRLSVNDMLMRVEKLFNSQRIPIIATHEYKTIEHDDDEVFIHQPHLARYYSNRMNFVLKEKLYDV